ncbi:response regulator [Ruegeria atlantica]|uniref:response regulator n=1 Tax=Ruegeria atlantica TaxID=81569 RepID=UPI00147C8593|nr:response regulator [Ruegeria atlantica]
MVDVLIVEDDPHKSEELVEFITSELNVQWVKTAVSVSEAIKEIDNQKFDLVLLDMALPSHTQQPGKGPPSSLLSGGLEVIHEFDYTQRIDPIVILTQYHEVEIDGELVALKFVKERLCSMFTVRLLDCVHYEMGSDMWQKKLGEVVRKL